MPQIPAHCFYCKAVGYLIQVDSWTEDELPILVCRLCLRVGIVVGQIEEYKQRAIEA